MNAGSRDAACSLGSQLINQETTEYASAASYFRSASAVPHIHCDYNLGMMYRNGFGVGISCQDGLAAMRASAERMAWLKWFPKAYELYMLRQNKVAALMYMVLGYAGAKVPQTNAANILESERVFDEKLWAAPQLRTDINRHLAFSFYKMAELQGFDYAGLRIGMNYYYGYTDEPDPVLALAYFERALITQFTDSSTAYAHFHYGTIMQFGMGTTKDYTRAREAYDVCLAREPKALYPVKIMLWMMDVGERGFFSSLNISVNASLGMAITMWVAGTVLLVWRRKL